MHDDRIVSVDEGAKPVHAAPARSSSTSDGGVAGRTPGQADVVMYVDIRASAGAADSASGSPLLAQHPVEAARECAVATPYRLPFSHVALRKAAPGKQDLSTRCRCRTSYGLWRAGGPGATNAMPLSGESQRIAVTGPQEPRARSVSVWSSCLSQAGFSPPEITSTIPWWVRREPR
jgi:hypothetical protein